MGGFGVAARPFEHRLQIRRVLYRERRFGVERRIVYHSDNLPGGLVAQGEVVCEIILAEFVIIGEQPFDSTLLLDRRLLYDR